MPAFWQQPLTWLFFAATACLDVVAFKRFWMSEGFELLLMGQAIVAGGWLALGTSHRLARAGVALGLILALSAHDYVRERRFAVTEEWQHVLGAYLCLVLGTALSAWLLSEIVGRPHRKPGDSHWRISIAEILGWMVITAVAAATLPHARFTLLAFETSYIQIAALPAAAAALMVAFLPAPAPSTLRANLIAVALPVTLILMAPLAADFTELVACGITLAYIASWIMVRRLDARPRVQLGRLHAFAP